MRSLTEAASSRVVNEMRARYASSPAGADSAQWAHWGQTPGGVVYSLNAIDQARLLALGFHELLHVLVKRNIPVLLLDFPRFVEDPEYLFQSLQGILGDKIERLAAGHAHALLASPAKVRLGKELSAEIEPKTVPEGTAPSQAIAFPTQASLDRIAMARELALLKTEFEQMKGRLFHAEQRRASVEASTSWRVTAPLRALAGLLKRPAAPDPAAGSQHQGHRRFQVFGRRAPKT